MGDVRQTQLSDEMIKVHFIRFWQNKQNNLSCKHHTCNQYMKIKIDRWETIMFNSIFKEKQEINAKDQ